ncbi:MAG: gliding motility-associated C-terminal domain-containing protein [Bacteroidia bacterium]
MCPRRLWPFLLGLLLAQQPRYRLSFLQQYRAYPNTATPDSLDIYLLIERTEDGIPPDELASSNFPFLYNPDVLNFTAARVIHVRKFHDDPYYEPITYTVAHARVNVTIRRRPHFQHPADTLEARDTLIGFRVPLFACGSERRSVLLWDSGPAAVLNSALQDMKPRLTWRNDTLASLCPPPPSGVEYAYDCQPNVCEGTRCTLQVIRIEAGLLDTLCVRILYNGGGVATFCNSSAPHVEVIFDRPGPYNLQLLGGYRKCRCMQPHGTFGGEVIAPPRPHYIAGRDTIYAQGTYSYTLTPSGNNVSWTFEGNVYAGNSISLTPSSDRPVPRTEVLTAIYEVPGNPCRGQVQKSIRVIPCPSGGRARATTRNACVGQSVGFILRDLPVTPDSVRWQILQGANWVDLGDEVTGATLPICVLVFRQAGLVTLRARVHYGGCTVYSEPEAVSVSGEFLRREFRGLTSPICAGDTAYLFAEGRGRWITRNGRGTFTDPSAPNSAYVSDPADPPNVEICWVVREEDLSACREREKDTLCLTLGIQASDAVGQVEVGLSQVCPGGRVPLQGTITVGTRGYWTTDGQGFFSPDPNQQRTYYVSASGDAGRWVRFTWNVVGNCGRQVYTDSVFVRTGISPAIVGPNRACENVALQLQAVPAEGIDTLWWFEGSLAQVEAAGPLAPTNPYFRQSGPTYNAGQQPVGRDTFTLYARKEGCESFSQLPVEVLAAPTATFAIIEPCTQFPCVLTMNRPEIRLGYTGQGAVSYVWNFGEAGREPVGGTATPTYQYREPGTYSIALFVQNEMGCSDFYICTDCIKVLPRQVYLPNAFSPNGDGKNDVFRPLPLEEGFVFRRLEIFDRWGQVVFEGENLSEWRGQGKGGTPLDPGTYSYRAVILIPYEGLVTYTGVVHLVY